MEKTIGVGYEFFDELIRDGNYYVDKTELIYELVATTKNKVSLFTRPRRFGKTLTMSMLESFFDITRDSRQYFEGLNIVKNHPDFCDVWMNRYPTLRITLKDVEGETFESAYEMLTEEISKLCIKYAFLESETKADSADVSTFQRLKNKTAKEGEIKNALLTVMRMLYAAYGKPVILLIDEYDVPLAKAEASKHHEYYKQMLGVIRGLLSTALKTNEYLKFAVVTGCLRVAKESIFTGVNNFNCYSVINGQFSQYFGFRPEEVKALLEQFNLTSKYRMIKKWYDGYIIGNQELFCPWDVMCYVASVLKEKNAKPGNYWASSSSNDILDDFVNNGKIDVVDKFEMLMNGGTITQDVSDELTYEGLYDSERNLWSLLLMTGYLSKANRSTGTKTLKLKIPNLEITELFRDRIVTKFNRKLDSSKVDSFIAAMWNRDTGTASSSLSDILWMSISYFDYAEDYYHGMINGIFTSRGYTIDSNDESGLGRLDVRVRDRANRRILLFEFKRVNQESELDAGCDEAIGQIITKGYARVMPEGYEYQIVYGMAFYGKKAKVKLMECPAG